MVVSEQPSEKRKSGPPNNSDQPVALEGRLDGESLHFLRSMWLWMSPLCSRLAIFYMSPRPGRQKNDSLFNCCAESLHFLRSMWLWMSPFCSRLAIFYMSPRPGQQKMAASSTSAQNLCISTVLYLTWKQNLCISTVLYLTWKQNLCISTVL